MYRKSLLFFFTLFFVTFAEAKVFDAIVLIVEGEAITNTEIRTVRSQLGVSKEEAIDLLIQDRLQKVAMQDINIPEDAVDRKIAMIAEKNNISVKKMQNVLRSQGTSWTKYRESIRDAMKKEQFFAQKVSKEIPEPTEDQLKLFYQQHKKQFTMPSHISVIEYSAPTQKAIDKFLKTKKGLKGKASTKSTKSLNSTLLQMMLQTPNGHFTRAINAGDRYVAYKVQSKSGKTQLDFENAKPMVAGYWKQEQQGKTLKDYFKKMRTRADIQILRK
jgi:peptidyl-prolyl cis-trans isomerase SurA